MKKLLWILACVVSFYAHAQTPLQMVEEDYKKKLPLYKKLPEFGVQRADLANYLSQNIVYTETAKAQQVEGDVILSFSLTDHGVVNNPQIIKGITPELDSQLVVVFRRMPKWKPAIGITTKDSVSSDFLIWINFSLYTHRFFNFQNGTLYGLGISALDRDNTPLFDKQEWNEMGTRKSKLILTQPAGATVKGRKSHEFYPGTLVEARLKSDTVLRSYEIEAILNNHLVLRLYQVDSTQKKRNRYQYQKSIKLPYQEIIDIVYLDRSNGAYYWSSFLHTGGAIAAGMILLVGTTEVGKDPATWIVFGSAAIISYLGYKRMRNLKPKMYHLGSDWILRPIIQ